MDCLGNQGIIFSLFLHLLRIFVLLVNDALILIVIVLILIAFPFPFLAVIVQAQVFHHLEEFLKHDCTIKLWLGQNSHEIRHLFIAEIIDTDISDTFEEALRLKKFVGFTFKFSFKNLVLENLPYGWAVSLNDFLCDSDENAFGNIYHFVFIIKIFIIFTVLSFFLLLILFLLLIIVSIVILRHHLDLFWGLVLFLFFNLVNLLFLV